MNIYVGNLSYEVTEEDLQEALEAFGQVESVRIIKDKYSGQSKGFGFVEMPSKAEGQSAIDGLNGKELKGRTINVNEARPRTENRGGAEEVEGVAVASNHRHSTHITMIIKNWPNKSLKTDLKKLIAFSDGLAFSLSRLVISAILVKFL
jgi:RNA recognition motif-containing protein